MRNALKEISFNTIILIVYFSAFFIEVALARIAFFTEKPIFIISFSISVVVISYLIAKSYNNLKSFGKNLKNAQLISVLIILWILPQLFLVGSIEYEYQNLYSSYGQEYTKLINEGIPKLNATWQISNSFKRDFDGIYGINKADPSRLIKSDIIPIISPSSRIYFHNLNGYEKLTVAQKYGRCQEFTAASTFLIKDISGTDIRIIDMEGKDHTFPEVYCDGCWWVFDLVYTTQNFPVRAKDYASYLKANRESLYEVVSSLKTDSGKVVIKEHGFNSSVISVQCIKDMTTNPDDNKPLKDTVVEVYALNNSYDPLVGRCKTNESGNCSIELVSGKEYIFISKKDKGVGLTKIKPVKANESIKIYLHKYD